MLAYEIYTEGILLVVRKYACKIKQVIVLFTSFKYGLLINDADLRRMRNFCVYLYSDQIICRIYCEKCSVHFFTFDVFLHFLFCLCIEPIRQYKYGFATLLSVGITMEDTGASHCTRQMDLCC